LTNWIVRVLIEFDGWRFHKWVLGFDELAADMEFWGFGLLKEGLMFDEWVYVEWIYEKEKEFDGLESEKEKEKDRVLCCWDGLVRRRWGSMGYEVLGCWNRVGFYFCEVSGFFFLLVNGFCWNMWAKTKNISTRPSIAFC
jgi:hypothetical protein